MTAEQVRHAQINTSCVVAYGRHRQSPGMAGPQPVTGLSTVNHEHSNILSALTIKTPNLNTQLTLL